MAALVLLCLPGMAATAALTNQPPGSIHISTNYYIFGGTNVPQMRAAMIAARPWKQNFPFDAQTKWNIYSRYNFARDHGEFRLASIGVETSVAITLPRWIPGKPVSYDLVTNWSRCFFGLTAHEQGHVVLARAAGAEVQRLLQELPSFHSQQELAAAAKRALDDTVEEYHRREIKYDHVTGHGRTQGAILVDVVRVEAQESPPGPSTNAVARPVGRRFRYGR